MRLARGHHNRAAGHGRLFESYVELHHLDCELRIEFNLPVHSEVAQVPEGSPELGGVSSTSLTIASSSSTACSACPAEPPDLILNSGGAESGGRCPEDKVDLGRPIGSAPLRGIGECGVDDIRVQV